MRVGGFILMAVMFLRGLLYFFAALTDGQYMVQPSPFMRSLLYILGFADMGVAVYGAWGVYLNHVEKLRIHAAYRFGVMLFFAPYFCGYLLFDSSMVKSLPLLVSVLIITVGVLIETVLLLQLYKLILYEMKVDQNRAKEPLVNKFDMPEWLVGDPNQALVIWKSVPLPLAVSAFAVLTLTMCFMGLVVITFFPSVGMAFGFYSESIAETRTIGLLADITGLYFCVSCVAAVKRADSQGMKIYLLYQIYRFCSMIPVVAVNNLMGNICGTRHEMQRSMGYPDPHDVNYHGSTNASCTSREHLYWVFCAICFSIHGYFIYLTWLLLSRYEAGAMAEKLSGASGHGYGTRQVERGSSDVNMMI